MIVVHDSHYKTHTIINCSKVSPNLRTKTDKKTANDGKSSNIENQCLVRVRVGSRRCTCTISESERPDFQRQFNNMLIVYTAAVKGSKSKKPAKKRATSTTD
eukprot:902377_1